MSRSVVRKFLFTYYILHASLLYPIDLSSLAISGTRSASERNIVPGRGRGGGEIPYKHYCMLLVNAVIVLTIVLGTNLRLGANVVAMEVY